MFDKIEGGQALLWQNGVSIVADVYEYENALYAKAKGGYINLQYDKRTSHSAVRWKAINIRYKKLGVFGYIAKVEI